MFYEVDVEDDRNEIGETYLVVAETAGIAERAAIRQVKKEFPSAKRHHFCVTRVQASRFQDVIYA